MTISELLILIFCVTALGFLILVVDGAWESHKKFIEHRREQRRKEEGPFKVVGWGPFPLPGERKRARINEARRIAEVNAMRKDDTDGT